MHHKKHKNAHTPPSQGPKVNLQIREPAHVQEKRLRARSLLYQNGMGNDVEKGLDIDALEHRIQPQDDYARNQITVCVEDSAQPCLENTQIQSISAQPHKDTLTKKKKAPLTSVTRKLRDPFPSFV
jgi:hypothetical protein